MRDSSRLFSILDRSDPSQIEISRCLWLLRSSIVFTLLPFDDVSLGLKKIMGKLILSSCGLQEAELLLGSLQKELDELVTNSVNMKREWLLRTITEEKDTRVGVLCALAAGKSPGWPSEIYLEINRLFNGIKLISSGRDLRSGVFKRIILPCSCRNVYPALLLEVIHSGRSSIIDVLLYSGEKFDTPKRLVLPECSIFRGKLQNQIRQHEVHKVREENAVDAWMNEAFWQGVHGGHRHAEANLVSANYVLFYNGTGTFLPANGRVPILPENVMLSDVSDLRLVSVEDVSEGDLVVIRAGDSSFLLDEASDQIMKSSGYKNLVNEATDWKNSLEALLLTYSCEAVSEALQQRSISISPASISQWAGPDVLGPGSERVFKELIRLLGDKGKLQMDSYSLEEYADNRWISLQELRSVRQRAGNMIRQELLKKLFIWLGRETSPLGDCTSIHLEGDSSVEMLILRVASKDQNPAFVPTYRLCRLDDLRGNKWLE